jgi:hypothetical protein
MMKLKVVPAVVPSGAGRHHLEATLTLLGMGASRLKLDVKLAGSMGFH